MIYAYISLCALIAQFTTTNQYVYGCLFTCTREKDVPEGNGSGTSKNSDDYSDRSIYFTENGSPCTYTGYCQEGFCLNDTSSSTSASDTIETTTMNTYTNTTKLKSASERCQKMGMEFTDDTIHECTFTCTRKKDVPEGKGSGTLENINDYGDTDIYFAENGLPCTSTGYCNEGFCLNLTTLSIA
ncbi:uncharacterized protein LOC122502617 isoform X2 [Leptopilina heterotoma]|uniref:uncharacterized protein LOC122502617 isoform X2 n=1 Tax=Leptopilina heterotoma TaxID=63436 RepID=UPI001CAA0E25|nr:uncharacterized protein LOC122502617 isoform X2 [Leptopilina heterotoma]